MVDTTANSEHKTEALSTVAQELTEALKAFTRVAESTLSKENSSTLAESLRQAADVISSQPRQTQTREENSDGERTAAGTTAGKLITAAKRLFATNGFEGTSVTDIANEAGFTRGAFYANFASKDALLLDIIDELAYKNSDWLTDNAQLFLQGEQSSVSIDSETTLDTLLTLEIWRYTSRHPEIRDRVSSPYKKNWSLLAESVRRHRNHDVTTEADYDTAFGITAVHTLAQLFAFITGHDEAENSAQRVLKFLVNEMTDDKDLPMADS